MTDLVAVLPGDPPGTFAGDLVQVPTEALRARLAEAIGVTVRTLSYLAAVWNELERRGEDLSDLRGGLMTYLPMIAAGRLDPEIVVRCAGQVTLLKAAAGVPVKIQRQLIERGARVVELDAGVVVERVVPVDELTVVQVRRVFASDGLRLPAEQARILSGPPQRASGRAGKTKVTVYFSKAEHETVRARAREAGLRVPAFLRGLATAGPQ